MATVSAYIDSLTWERAILWVLGLSALLVVADAAGLLPSRVSRWINRNLADRTLETLERLGIDVPSVRRRNIASAISIHVEGATLRERVIARLERATIRKHLSVGSGRKLPTNSFIDVMGATTDRRSAEALAADLVAHWRNLLENNALKIQGNVDFVVTPKSGSPILGYEFAKLLGKPFVAFNSDLKFVADALDFRAEFDCATVPLPGARALLVDDSSTGGAKALRAVKRLKHFNYEISDFIVLFEPMLKATEGANAAKRLEPLGVALRAIFQS